MQDSKYGRLAHALTHSWQTWTHHREPLRVCSDDTFDMLADFVPMSDDENENENEFARASEAVYASLAAHGIPTDHFAYPAADSYGCPDGLQMAPLTEER